MPRPSPTPDMEPEPEPEPVPTAESMVERTKRKAGFLRGAMGRTDEVTPFLLLGGKASASDWQAFEQHRITHVINATTHIPNAFEERGICYIRVSVPDTEATDIARHFGKVVSFIDAARRVGGRVLVHCSAGMSRSVTLVLAYLLTTGTGGGSSSSDGRPMSLIDAFRLVKSKRTVVAPNPEFMSQLCAYELLQRPEAAEGVEASGTAVAVATEAAATGAGISSFDISRYRKDRFGKCDSYVVAAYKQTVHD
jgi:protein-tyrosine phosphatase